MIHDKVKKIIFNKLYQDLSHVEIIPYKESIWFIDRENKFWYFEYVKPGVLYWRYDFFMGFFNLFALKQDEFQWIISEWVEEVLNCKVGTPVKDSFLIPAKGGRGVKLQGWYTHRQFDTLNLAG